MILVFRIRIEIIKMKDKEGWGGSQVRTGIIGCQPKQWKNCRERHPEGVQLPTSPWSFLCVEVESRIFFHTNTFFLSLSLYYNGIGGAIWCLAYQSMILNQNQINQSASKRWMQMVMGGGEESRVRDEFEELIGCKA